MTQHSEFTYYSNAALNDVLFSDVVARFKDQAKSHDLNVQIAANEVSITVPFGRFGAYHESGQTKLFANSPQADWLFGLKDAIMDHLAEDLPKHVENLRWSDDEYVDISGADKQVNARFPPNFNLARAISVRPVGKAFLRVRVTADDLTRFTNDSLHFRLALPNADITNTVWPSLGPNGQTQWPKGEHTLHNPVYTVRHIDVAQKWLEFDVFIHEGGRVTNWVRDLRPGAIVGLVGPGGGGIPAAQDILLSGDETAFPAIARILESADGPKSGQVFLMSQVLDYDFIVPDGFTMHWCASEVEFVASLTSMSRSSDTFVWFGGEKSVAQILRSHFRDECGLRADACLFSGYWRNDQ